jgi:pentatricopeptide repeat protein
MKGLLLLEADPALGNSLVHMYVKCGLLDDAKHAVFTLRARDTITWSILISGYVDEGWNNDAIECFFGHMQKNEGLLPDAIAFASVLSACGNIAASDLGKEIHDRIAKTGLLPRRDGDAVLGNALISMYAKCGEFEHARRVFDELHVRNVASWTALLSSSGYNREQEEEEQDDDDDDEGEAAFASFVRMKLEGISPNLVTYACVLKACSSSSSRSSSSSSSSSSSRSGEASNAAGKRIHCEISAQGLLEKKPSCELAAALIGMYAACGSFAEARKALDQPSFRNIVMWNAIVSGYLRRDESAS